MDAYFFIYIFLSALRLVHSIPFMYTLFHIPWCDWYDISFLYTLLYIPWCAVLGRMYLLFLSYTLLYIPWCAAKARPLVGCIFFFFFSCIPACTPLGAIGTIYSFHVYTIVHSLVRCCIGLVKGRRSGIPRIVEWCTENSRVK